MLHRALLLLIGNTSLVIRLFTDLELNNSRLSSKALEDRRRMIEAELTRASP
jgi:hypothetical protein